MPRCFYRRIPLSITAVVLLLTPPRGSAGAQSTEFGAAPRAAEAGQKSPTLARVIGILPGAGHMYAGETGRGFAYLGGMVGVLLFSSMLVATDCTAGAFVRESEDSCPSSPLIMNAAATATLGIWGWSIYDAARAANQTNARRGLRVSMRLIPTMQGRSLRRATGAGALVAIRLGLH